MGKDKKGAAKADEAEGRAEEPAKDEEKDEG